MRVGLGAFEELIEFSIEQAFAIFHIIERFLEGVFAFSGGAFQLLHGFGEVLDGGGGSGVGLMVDDGLKGGVDFQFRLTAGAGDFEGNWFCGLGHKGNRIPCREY